MKQFPSILKTLFALIILGLVILLFASCGSSNYCHTYSSATYNAGYRASEKCYTNGVNPVFPRRKN